VLIKLIAPFAPHVADEAWEMLGEQGFVIETTWPQYADALAIDSEAKLVVQVNGKLRGIMHAARDASEAAIRAQALALPPVAKHVENRAIKSILIVPHKVVNIVTE
jgi:leucyl-tRNA synthetase